MLYVANDGDVLVSNGGVFISRPFARQRTSHASVASGGTADAETLDSLVDAIKVGHIKHIKHTSYSPHSHLLRSHT